MNQPSLSPERAREILAAAGQTRILVVGDVMLDHFVWGHVARISPEAPVPVVEFDRESFIPGGAANVARNLTSLGLPTSLFGVVGRDPAAKQLKELLAAHEISGGGLVPLPGRFTSVKTRIVAHQQQVVRLDRETRATLDRATSRRLIGAVKTQLSQAAAVIVGDYGKGAVTQSLLDELKQLCRQGGIWLSVDPKPVHRLDLTGLSLITPNRKEAFELANILDETRHANPLADRNLMLVVERLLLELRPAVLLVTLGELGMLLCQTGSPPVHIPTRAKEVFDVSGAGDTVIAAFTLAIAAGATPIEAALLSNHAAGIVVGKVGTAVVTPEELTASFKESAN